jgi:hypothetical protein
MELGFLQGTLSYRKWMQPSDAIHLVERVLRDLIRELLGERWQEHRSIDMEKLEEARGTEATRRRGALLPNDLLEYADFMLLGKIIENHWEDFKPVLGSIKHFKVYMDRLATFRNPVMHTRSLLPFEESLVSGMTGEWRNSIAIWRSTKGPDMKYYAEISSVRDSFGVEAVRGRSTHGPDLRPGDSVVFKCAATDPEGRQLNWKLSVSNQNFSTDVVDHGTGEEVDLAWAVTDDHIRENQTATIMLTSDSQYHRNGSYDEAWVIYYNVLPRLTSES